MSDEQEEGKQKRGFAAMPKEKVQEIASKGGHASAEKAGHEGMAERGRKGGQANRKDSGGDEGQEEEQEGGEGEQ